jgi:pimeloyl-ACP methyl ester carboxylesterase
LQISFQLCAAGYWATLEDICGEFFIIMGEIAFTTINRLNCVAPGLARDTVERVAEAAEIAHEISSLALYEAANTDGPKWIRYGGCPDARILDMPAEHNQEPHAAIVVCLPMARGLDAAEVRRASRLKRLFPDDRMIFMASPDGWNSPAGRLTKEQRHAVRSGEIRPMIASLLHYLHEHGITTVDWVGNSYGARTAVAAAAFAAENQIHIIRRVVSIETPDAVARGFVGLALAFYSTRKRVADHMGALTDPVFAAALEQQPDLPHYILNLASPANWAIAHGIARGQFEANMRTLLECSPEAHVTVAYGTHSELVLKEHIEPIMKAFEKLYPGRTEVIRLDQAAHACYLDIDVIQAIIAHGLRGRPAAEIPGQRSAADAW